MKQVLVRCEEHILLSVKHVTHSSQKDADLVLGYLQTAESCGFTRAAAACELAVRDHFKLYDDLYPDLYARLSSYSLHRVAKGLVAKTPLSVSCKYCQR